MNNLDMLDEVKSVFLVGIKGVAMANLAVILKKMGKDVSGSDIGEEFITDELLARNNIQVSVGFVPSNVPRTTAAVVYSAAHGGDDNPQVDEAKKRGIKVYHQAEFLDRLMKNFKTKVAVCGSHGKTTTASLLAYALLKLGAKPSYLVGSPSFNEYQGGDYLGNEYFVFEADEYGVNPPKDKTIKFNFFNPDIIICTNIDFDHPDVFEDLEHVRAEFEKFFKKANKVFLCPADGDLKHTACVVEALVELGFKKEDIRKAVQGFTGAKRRFEQKAYINDIYLFDDYAHHPAEIEATIEAAKRRFKNRRIIVIFQPHTYSRTQALLKQFKQSLQKADVIFLAPIFASARENSTDFSISSSDIIKEAAYDSKKEILAKLKDNLKPGDVIFTMGAGDIYKLERDIIEIIKTI